MRTEDDVREADEVGSPAGAEPRGGRVPAIVIVAALLAALHLWLATRAEAPSLLWDGLGYLGNARWLGGADATPWLGPLSFYHAGYSLLLVPFTVLSDDPGTVFRGALLVNAAASVAAFFVLVHLARSFLGLAPRKALLAATVAALYPPVVMQTGYEWSESVFAAAFAATTAVVWWYARRRSAASAVVLAAAVVGLYLLHPRALPLVPLAAVVLVVGAGRRRTGPVAAVAGVAVLGAGYAVTALLHDAMRTAVYAPRPDRTAALVGTLLDPSEWGSLAERAAGQLWYLLVATGGLAAVGVVVLAGLVGAGRRPEAAATDGAARRLAAGWVLAAVVGVLVASALQMLDPSRVDHVVYGRYVEATAPVLLLAAVAGVLGLAGRRAVVATLVVAAGLTVAFGVMLWEADAERFSGDLASMNIFGVMVFDRTDPGHLDVVPLSLVVGAVALALAALARLAPVVLASVLVVVPVGLVVDLETRVATSFKESADQAFRLGPTIAELGPDAVAVAEEAYRMTAVNEYQHENPDVPFEVVEAPLDAGPGLVVHRRDWPEGVAAGAHRLATEPNWDVGLWVLPGSLRDRLEADGQLVDDDGAPVVDEAEPEPEPPPDPTPVTEPPPPPVPASTPDRGDGTFAVAGGESAVVGSGALRRFSVEVEGGLGADPARFAAAVEAALFDDRSWAGGSIGGTPVALQRVADGPVDIRVVLASPATTDALCAPLRTNGIYSCNQGDRAVINARRWREGAEPSGLGGNDYRTYVVNHEVGHALGHGHRPCPSAGAPAPVMMQQTKGIGACAPNPWPLAAERGGG